MKRLPPNSAAVVWTALGPKIVRTDACGDMVELSSLRAAQRAGAKPLPDALTRLLASQQSSAPDSGASPLS